MVIRRKKILSRKTDIIDKKLKKILLVNWSYHWSAWLIVPIYIIGIVPSPIIYLYILTDWCGYRYTYIYKFACTYTNMYNYTYTYVYLYVYLYEYIYVYVHL